MGGGGYLSRTPSSYFKDCISFLTDFLPFHLFMGHPSHHDLP